MNGEEFDKMIRERDIKEANNVLCVVLNHAVTHKATECKTLLEECLSMHKVDTLLEVINSASDKPTIYFKLVYCRVFTAPDGKGGIHMENITKTVRDGSMIGFGLMALTQKGSAYLSFYTDDARTFHRHIIRGNSIMVAKHSAMDPMKGFGPLTRVVQALNDDVKTMTQVFRYPKSFFRVHSCSNIIQRHDLQTDVQTTADILISHSMGQTAQA